MRITTYALALILPAVVAAADAGYRAEDFGRLVQKHPLVVAGKMIRPVNDPPEHGGAIAINHTLKNALDFRGFGPGGGILLKATSNNLYWARAVIQYEKGQTGVWVLDTEIKDGKVLPASVVAHFAVAEADLGKGQAAGGDAPLTKWGSSPGKRWWGVVKSSDAGRYDDRGRFLGVLTVGTVLDISTFRSSSAGEVAVCRPVGSMADKADMMVLARSVIVHPGSISKVSPEKRNLCIQEAQIEARLQATKDNLLNQGTSSNPYATRYRKAKADYDRFWKKVRALQSKRDRARGASKVRYADELRKLKGDDIRIGRTFAKTKKLYDSWERRNRSRQRQDPRVRALEEELAAVKRQFEKAR